MPMVARARFVLGRKRTPVVAFSGVDGSGKSSLVRQVADELNNSGVECTVVWTRPGMRLGPFSPIVRGLSRLRGQDVPRVREIAGGADPTSSRAGFAGTAWATFITVLFVLDVRWRHHSGRGVKLYDRHVADGVVTLDFVYRGADLRLSRALVRHLVPRADISFYLDVPADVAVARKPGDSFGLFAVEQQLASYDRALAPIRPLIRLDARLPQEDLLRRAVDVIRSVLPSP